MPKVAAHAVIWLAEQATYALREPENPHIRPLPSEGEAWSGWLAAHSSFAFQGKRGHLTLRKESRASREGYWYAYRCQNQRTVKRYAGRANDLTIARLEEVAGEINAAFALPQARNEEDEASLEPESPAPPLPLLTSKLRLPHLHSSLIRRERLLERLDACLEHKLTMLCAPAGSGKTTLVRQWIVENSEQVAFPPIAWVSLDAGDNDPARFWRAILTAAQTWYATPDQHILNLLLSSTQPSTRLLTLEVVLTTFLNEINQQNITGLLVLEDYHTISETRIHETVSFFLSYLPETLHVVLVTRHEPPLPLARLRANGELHEIQTADLRFSPAESAAFLQDFSLSAEALEQLDAHLEGWAAGLRLLFLALQGKTIPLQVERLRATFSGSHRPVLDYFVAEVLHAQTADLQDFLLRTSGLPRLTASLCAAVTGQRESADLLKQIERGNLFLEALDESGEWYRYHTLFAEAMQHEARQRLSEDELCAVAYNASCWFEQQGLLSEAIEAAFQARASERAASLMEQLFQSPQMQEIQERHTQRRWLEQLPEAILQQSPVLCFGYAAALIFDRDAQAQKNVPSEQIEALLQRAEESWRASNNLPRLGEVYAFRAFSSLQQGRLTMGSEALACARQALDWLPAREEMWRGLSLITLAIHALQRGKLQESRSLFEQAESLTPAKSNAAIRSMAALFLGMIYFAQGHLHQAARSYSKLSNQATRQEIHPVLSILPMGRVLYEWNELDALEQEIQRAIDMTAQFGSNPENIIHLATEVLLACLYHARGKTELAVQRLAAFFTERRVFDENFSLFIYHEALLWLVRFSLLLEDQFNARRWLSEMDRYQQHYNLATSGEVPLLQTAGDVPVSEQAESALSERGETGVPALFHEQNTLLRARFSLGRGEPEAALRMLNVLLPEAQAAGRGQNVLQTKLLLAQAYAASKQASQARRWLLEALEQGYLEGYTRSFLDEGERIFHLLREVLPHLRSEPLRGYAQVLLRGFASERSDITHVAAVELVEPLSQQEQRVLHLLIAGRSNPEIAQELVVSVNTVRTQIKSIYHKLNVHDRHAACEVARQLHLD